MKDELQNIDQLSLNQHNVTEKGSLSQTKFDYKMLFPKAEEYPYDIDDLIALAKKMTDVNNMTSDSPIPAGYTYLGQFIDHEISNAVIPESEEQEVSNMVNNRTSIFDLESLYGQGPVQSSQLYETDTLLKLGITEGEGTGGVKSEFINDLPRKDGKPTAEIMDARNDENLIVAQTQVAFIKFHNAVVNSLKDTAKNLFKEAQEKVIRHFQWIVLNDYLPRIIKKSVLDDVKKRNEYYFPTAQDPFIPAEFAAAAFRFGHSMVRISYEWNKVFSTSGVKPLDISDLMTFTGPGGLSSTGKERCNLPSAWVADWRRLFELPNPKGVTFNQAQKIDTVMAPMLGFFPGVPEPDSSLAFRNLRRGFVFKLSTGQTVAKQMGVNPLTPEQLDQKLPADLQTKFNTETPLWYYVLAEAEIQEKGEMLGEVGSRLVAETIFGLIRISPISILSEPEWKPTLGEIAGQFGMPDLLKFVASQSRFGDAELNPIGD